MGGLVAQSDCCRWVCSADASLWFDDQHYWMTEETNHVWHDQVYHTAREAEEARWTFQQVRPIVQGASLYAPSTPQSQVNAKLIFH